MTIFWPIFFAEHALLPPRKCLLTVEVACMRIGGSMAWQGRQLSPAHRNYMVVAPQAGVKNWHFFLLFDSWHVLDFRLSDFSTFDFRSERDSMQNVPGWLRRLRLQFVTPVLICALYKREISMVTPRDGTYVRVSGLWIPLHEKWKRTLLIIEF